MPSIYVFLFLSFIPILSYSLSFIGSGSFLSSSFCRIHNTHIVHSRKTNNNKNKALKWKEPISFYSSPSTKLTNSLAMSNSNNIEKPTATSTTMSVTLDKPLGLILTEVIEDAPEGIVISEINPTGSAYTSPYKVQLMGSKIMAINQINVNKMMFDDIMELIVSSKSPIQLTIMPQEKSIKSRENVGVDAPTTTTIMDNSSSSSINFDSKDTMATKVEEELPIGTMVQLTISLKGESSKDTIIQTKVGDNLRKTLLDNNIELYRGWKKKLGNCGGAGQCTFCAVDVIVDESLNDKNYWGPRSDYEEMKIGKKMSSQGRLACMNNIQGPATIIIPPP